jgi:hypothetical protein
MESLIPTLKGICLEHLAMRRLLRENNPRWRVDVHRLCDSPKYKNAVDSQFHAVLESQQLNSANEINSALLLEALSTTNLED